MDDLSFMTMPDLLVGLEDSITEAISDAQDSVHELSGSIEVRRAAESRARVMEIIKELRKRAEATND